MLEPQPAATVMLAREGAETLEFFMLRRTSRSAFMPDVFVFPGGRVEDQDRTLQASARLAGAAAGADAAWVHAAARETFEECGLLLARDPVDHRELDTARRRLLGGSASFEQVLAELGTRIDAGALHYFSRWITPPLETRRFDTHFFVARAPAGQLAQADRTETHDGLWIAPREALVRSAAGTLRLILPTIKHLERVSAFDSIDELLAYTASKAISPVMPYADGAGAFVVPAALEGVW